MHQKPIHTEPSPNSQASAYGYKYAGSMASHGVAWRHTVTEPGYKAYRSSVGKALYVKDSKTGYTYLAYWQAGFGSAALRIPSHSKRTTNKAQKPKSLRKHSGAFGCSNTNSNYRIA